MKLWIDRILLAAVLVVILVLVASTANWMVTGQLGGIWLLMHMGASGALVVSLPLLGIFCVWANISRHQSGGLQRLGFWLLIASGVATIATVFLCMLPLPSTEQMHELMVIHRYAGFAMVPAVVFFVWGSSRWRRMRATRSATLG